MKEPELYKFHIKYQSKRVKFINNSIEGVSQSDSYGFGGGGGGGVGNASGLRFV